jgi:hypothetical protein
MGMSRRACASPEASAIRVRRRATLKEEGSMKGLPGRIFSRDTLLAFALVALVVQAFAFSGAGRAVADKVQAVLVTNTTSEPVPVTVQNTTAVRDADNPARQPFQTMVNISIPDGGTGGDTSFTVPAGKRLVITYAGTQIVLPPGQQALSAVLWVNYPVTSAVLYPFRADFTAPNVSGEAVYIGGGPMTAYSEPGSTVQVTVNRSGTAGTASGVVTVSGYLVDVP